RAHRAPGPTRRPSGLDGAPLSSPPVAGGSAGPAPPPDVPPDPPQAASSRAAAMTSASVADPNLNPRLTRIHLPPTGTARVRPASAPPAAARPAAARPASARLPGGARI